MTCSIAQNWSTKKIADVRIFEEIVFREGLGLRWKVKGLLEAWASASGKGLGLAGLWGCFVKKSLATN
jgi:hypothetical protein